MTLIEMKVKLEQNLTNKRFTHSINVMKCAVDLAARFGEDRDKAAAAGLLHDCARDIKGAEIFLLCERYEVHVDQISRFQPELLHGPLGARIAEYEYGIDSKEITRSIRFHTTGCEDMTLLDKIIFIADYIEPKRDFPGVGEIRREAFKDIDQAMVMALDRTIKYIISKGTLIHPDTVDARNFLILKAKERGSYES